MAVVGTGPPVPALKKMFDWYDRRGLTGSNLTLRAILGREPRTLHTFFEELNAGSVGEDVSELTYRLAGPAD